MTVGGGVRPRRGIGARLWACVFALLLLCLLAPSARAATLLWITADVTPATRTALSTEECVCAEA